MTYYSKAPDVAEIAADLIETVDRHADLMEFRIDYVFRDKAAVKGGKLVFGSARLVSGLNAYLAHSSAGFRDPEANRPMLVVEIALDVWARLNGDERKALVDHQLCHFAVVEKRGETTVEVVGHDVEEFFEIVERHGIWSPDLAGLTKEMLGQGALALSPAVAAAAEKFAGSGATLRVVPDPDDDAAGDDD